MKRFLTYLVVVLVAVTALAEVYLRLTGKYATYPESIGQRYSTYYNDVFPTWYFINKPDTSYMPPNSDFNYPYSINSLGLREKEFSKQKSDSSLRIFVTGDSFAEGQGAPYDSTWVHLLSKYLADSGVYAETINTGVAGSDPVYNYIFTRDKMRGYKADYLVVCINYSDFTDYYFRGGLERFHTDGTTHYRKGPWFEPIYHYSYLARGVIEKAGGYPFRGIFANEKDFTVNAHQAISCYSAIIDSFTAITARDSTQLVVLLFSTPLGIAYKNNLNNEFRQCFAGLQMQLTQKHIACINIWDDLKNELQDKNYLQYAYQHDPHFNPYGYNAMARLVAKRLIEQKIISR